MEEIIVKGNTAIVDTVAPVITPDLYTSYISYLDAKPKTVATYTRAIRQFANWLSFKGIVRPTREDILAFREELKADHKASTVQSYIVAVRLFFQWTEQEGLYPNIAQHIKGATISKDHKKDYLTSKQVKAVLSEVDRDSLQGKRDYAILALMITGGLRDIEVHRANIEDLRTRGDNTVLYLQGKGREERTDFVQIPEATEKAIREYLKERGTVEPTDPLFTSLSNNSKGNRISTRSISGVVKDRLKSAGYDSERLTAHSLRHTAVTLSLIGGKSVQEVQQFARHSNISTTMIYAHNLDRDKNQCANTIAEAIF